MKNQFVWTLWKLHSDPAPVVIRNTDTSISYTIKITFVIGTILQFYIHSFWFNKHSESDQWIAGGTASAQSRYTMSILSVSSCNYFIICQQSTIIYIIHLLWFSAPFRTWPPLTDIIVSSLLMFCFVWDPWQSLRSPPGRHCPPARSSQRCSRIWSLQRMSEVCLKSKYYRYIWMKYSSSQFIWFYLQSVDRNR